MKGIKNVFGLAGTSVALGIIGSKLESSGVVSTGVSSAISAAGDTSSKFIAPAVNIHMGGYLIKQLKGLGKCCKE
jgi:hypothetical protein